MTTKKAKHWGPPSPYVNGVPSVDGEQEAADLSRALKNQGFDLSIHVAVKIIADMHEIARTRRLKDVGNPDNSERLTGRWMK